MIKNIKNVFVSPIFLILFLASIFIIALNYFSFSKEDYRYSSNYNINYHENINEYDEEIAYYKNILNELDKYEENYEETYLSITRTISIYEYLKENNLDYKQVYDFENYSTQDRLIYLISSESILLLLGLINSFVVIYLVFSREFDGSKYSLIYEYKRKRIIVKKILTSLIF